MNKEIDNLKKIIRYRLSYSGTKETDIIYKKLILSKIHKLDKKNLILLSNLFNQISDIDIFNILTKKIEGPEKYKILIKKLINE
mgnify:CR=1 FL=1